MDLKAIAETLVQAIDQNAEANHQNNVEALADMLLHLSQYAVAKITVNANADVILSDVNKYEPAQGTN